MFLFSYILSLLFIITYQTKKEIPDLFDGKYNGKLYSGYLKTDIPGNELFYVFVQSTSDHPNSDPVILWLNGGPGCSGLSTFLLENGPVIEKEPFKGVLELSEYTWNKEANIIYFDSPAGVGYSKSANKTPSYDDDMVAESSYTAVKNFFQEFPEYKYNDFYISGLSYGGVYVPFLARKIILKSQSEIKLKGILIGNPLIHYEYDHSVMIDLAYGHALISKEQWKEFNRNCPHYNSEIKNDVNVTKRCNEIRRGIRKVLDGINFSGIYKSCHPFPFSSNEFSHSITREELILKSLSKLRKMKSQDLEPEEPIYSSGCMDSPTIENFLNQPDIKKKLDVSDEMKWTNCNGNIYLNYKITDSYEFFTNFMPDHPELRVWIFSGDCDTVLPTLGTMRSIDSLHLSIKTEYKPYHTEGQVGGFVIEYENGLTIFTVKGAGHSATQDKRAELLTIFNAFLKGEIPS